MAAAGVTAEGLVEMVMALSEKPRELAAELAKASLVPMPLNVLEAMSPTLHSLGWLEVLHAASSGDGALPEGFAPLCRRFFIECSTEQIRCAPVKFSDLASRYTNAVVDVDALSAVHPLKVAVEKFRRSPEHLTPVHAEFAKVAIKARCCHTLQEVLDVDIVYLADGDYKLPVVSLLLYYYYGGVAYLTLKRFDRAMQFFSVVISAPAEQVSAIMVEAYKKYVLTSLLLHGKLVDLPAYTSFASRQLKLATPAYGDLVTSHKTSNADEFMKAVAKHHDKLSDDKNLGLAVHCHESVTRRNIRRLTEMFLTMSLQAIADRVNLAGPREAETALVDMIQRGEIHASIDQLTGNVAFHDDDETFDTEESLAGLHDRMAEVSALQEKLTELDIELRTSPHYIKKTQGDGSGGGSGVDFDPVGGMEGFGGMAGMGMSMGGFLS